MAGSLYLPSWRIAPCEVLAGFDTRHDTPPFKSRHHPNSRIAPLFKLTLLPKSFATSLMWSPCFWLDVDNQGQL
jgi:hypothetical protein